jgi:uncharacterized protein YdhG (YjbR/CyaY superfamily)
MAGSRGKSQDVDAYIEAFPPAVRGRLRKVRATIRANARQATEVISYNIPAYRQHGMLVYFAGFKGHIGLYPPVRGNAALAKAVAKYAGPKGNLKFPYDEALPLELIARIVRHKAKVDVARALAARRNNREGADELHVGRTAAGGRVVRRHADFRIGRRVGVARSRANRRPRKGAGAAGAVFGLLGRLGLRSLARLRASTRRCSSTARRMRSAPPIYASTVAG